MRGPTTGEAGASLPTPNSRTARRLTFVAEIARIMVETGLSQRRCFDAYNAEFNTFPSYQAYKDFRRRNRYQTLPPDRLNIEITRTFSKLSAITKDRVTGLERRTRRDMTDLDREEHRATVATLHAAIAADATFLDRLIDDYARHLIRGRDNG